jgi:hypothetical protein
MKASMVVSLLQAEIAKHGDMNVYLGDMEPLDVKDFDMIETAAVDAEATKMYGEKVLHIGMW